MIIELLLSIGLRIVTYIFGMFVAFEFDSSAVTALYDILVYGNWVVGADLLLIVMGCVSFWISTRLSIGFAIWVYEHIPFIN